MIDYGRIATDGAVKINRSDTSPTIFPHPRDKQVTVKLDLKAICPLASIYPAKVSVRALAAGTQADGAAGEGAVGGEGGKVGVGRFFVTW